MFKKIIYGMWCAVSAVTCMCEEVKGMDGVVLPKWVSESDNRLIFETVYMPEYFEKYSSDWCVIEIKKDLSRINSAWRKKDWLEVEALAATLLINDSYAEHIYDIMGRNGESIRYVQGSIALRLLELGIDRARWGLAYLRSYANEFERYLTFDNRSLSMEAFFYIDTYLRSKPIIFEGCVSEAIEKSFLALPLPQ